MIIEFDKSFVKSLDNINVVSVNKKIEKIIFAIEACKAVQHIPNIKKLSGFHILTEYVLEITELD